MQNSLLSGDEPRGVEVDNAVRKIKSQLPLIRTNPSDISLPPFWICPHTVEKIEALLLDPVHAPIQLNRWNQTILTSTSPLTISNMPELILLNSPLEIPSQRTKNNLIDLNAILEPKLRKSVRNICESIRQSQILVSKSYKNLNAEERNHIRILYQVPSTNSHPIHPDNKFKINAFRSLEKFKSDYLFQANQIILKSIEQEKENLQNWSTEMKRSKKSFNRVRLKTSFGDILISGIGDDFYSEKELENGCLLIDAGGNNRYLGPVASAKEGEVRVAMDWGESVVIESTQTIGGAGSGIFGIGYLFLPNEQGTKNILTGSYSQGFGLCGIGGFFINGKGLFKCDRYSQGVGAFGAGFFSNTSGEYSTYIANLYGQGVGLTKGVGIFKHTGSHAMFKAGLVDPDPREPLGMTSLCQGVGYGPRGFAAGGIGFCVVAGDQLNLESSYFAQGAGYWRAAGSFMMEGNNNIIKARRYDQGSGIHSALGYMNIKGGYNQIANWGVGPAFGWDGGTGWTILDGNHNQIQAEWGTGTASINNSRSFSVITGDHNQLNLPGLGSAQIARDIPDYSVSWIEGKNNVLKIPGLLNDQNVNGTFYRTPWGIVHITSGTFSSGLNIPKSEWLALTQGPASKQIDLETEIQKSETLPPQEKIEKLIQIASAFVADKSQTKKALTLLLNAKPSERNYVIDAIAPENLEEFIQIRIITSILGDPLALKILDELKTETDLQRKSWLISLLALLKAKNAVPTLMESMRDYNWRIQSVGLRVAGHLLNNDPVQPGRLYLLKKLERWLRSNITWRLHTQEISNDFARISFADALSVLSVAKNWTIEERHLILDLAPKDLSGNIEAKSAETLLLLLRTDKEDALRNIREEIQYCENSAMPIREKTISLLKQDLEGKFPKKELIHSALIVLGKIGRPEDIVWIEPFLVHTSALVREGVSLAFARIGKSSYETLEQSFNFSDPDLKKQSVIAASSTADPTLLTLLEKGLKDKNRDLQKMSLSAIEQIPAKLQNQQKKLRTIGKKLKQPHLNEELNSQIYFLYGE